MANGDFSPGTLTRGRVCVHCPGLYPALVPGSAPYVGGLETQQAIVLRGLRARGFDISAVSCGYGQSALEKVDGIRVYRSFVSSEGLPLLRFFHPRLSGMVRALVAADADVYLAQGSGLMAGVAYDVARALRGPFAFVIALQRHTRRMDLSRRSGGFRIDRTKRDSATGRRLAGTKEYGELLSGKGPRACWQSCDDQVTSANLFNQTPIRTMGRSNRCA